jgi:hypothetical protein
MGRTSLRGGLEEKPQQSPLWQGPSRLQQHADIYFSENTDVPPGYRQRGFCRIVD